MPTLFVSSEAHASSRSLDRPAARLHGVLLLWALLWLLALLAGPALLALSGVALNEHGHTHWYAHGHPFVDARTLWGLPNAVDVVTNLPLLLAGAYGLFLLKGGVPVLHQATRQAIVVFFVGLMLTGLCSAYYHWAPDGAGLVWDRLGMAVTFAGAIALAVAERASPPDATRVLWVSLSAAVFSAILPWWADNVLPWAVLQFGGVAVLLWLAFLSPTQGALGVRIGALIALYALAKLLELGDAAVFAATGEWVSGHSLKHVVAALAAWPVWQAVRQNAASTIDRQGDAAGALPPATPSQHRDAP